MQLSDISEKETGKAPLWFSLVAILAVLWNVAGAAAFVGQVTMSPDTFAQLSEEQQNLYASTPFWVTAAFGLAVFAGTLGSLFLVLRKSAASVLLSLSLAAVLVQMLHVFFLARTFDVLGQGAMVMPIVVIVIAIALALIAFKAKSEGWIR